jgi:hypothetical protein
MALAIDDILIGDRFSIVRTRINELIAIFDNFTFDAYSGDLTFSENFILEGDLTVEGEVYFQQEYLYLNSGEVGVGVTAGWAGLRVDRGSAADAILRFEEATDLWKVGLFGGSFTALSLVGHTHDDRYYTETEIGTLIYTKTQVNTLLSGYYTDDQVDILLGGYYTEGEVDTLLLDYWDIPHTAVGVMKVYTHVGTVIEDGTFALPAITTSAFGWVTVGDNAERSLFTINSTGTVTLISNSVNVVANADTDAKFCLGTAGAQEPLTVKLRLNVGTLNVNLVMWYD